MNNLEREFSFEYYDRVSKRNTYQKCNRKKRRSITNTIVKYIFATLLILSIVITLIYFAFPKNNVVAIAGDEYIEYTIMDGDTLWNVADRLSDGDLDIRKFIYTIEEINQISADEIYPGMVIQIPTID